MTIPTDQDNGDTTVNLAKLFQFRNMRSKLEQLLVNNDRTPANDPRIGHGLVPRAFFTPAPQTPSGPTAIDSKEQQEKDEPQGPKP